MRIKRWLYAIGIVLLLALLLQIVLGYQAYRHIQTLNDPYVKFAADRTCFTISPDLIDSVTLQNGNGQEIVVTDPDQITEIVDHLNALRFRYIAKKWNVGMGGWSYRLTLSGVDGETYYLFWDGCIEIDGLLTYTEKGYFSDWIDRLESLA